MAIICTVVLGDEKFCEKNKDESGRKKILLLIIKTLTLLTKTILNLDYYDLRKKYFLSFIAK